MRAGCAAVDLVAQAEFIERVIKRYNVEHSGIDITGMGDPPRTALADGYHP
ncbi:hypothetical protein [Zymobacter sp. IVIA_12111.31 C1]|uniref:hypothetical protein n=1 Tax=Zymobacter sp. IVIA_12111.31 C1 TaxID=3394854 RepID=UPI0039C2CE92